MLAAFIVVVARSANAERREPAAMNADDSARLRDVLASNRTLLAFVRTALAFAGLGFAVARFGLSSKATHSAGYLGTFMVLVGLLIAIIGFLQHRVVLREVGPSPVSAPAPSRVFHVAAAVGCVLVCALLAAYLATSAT